MHRKLILAIADGVGDRPSLLLNGKTPLEYAHTPCLDRLAANGTTGMMDLIGPGIPVGTDMGHLILFGYQTSDYPGRGPIEALGIGLEVQPGDVVLRCNFATIDQDGIVIDRRAGRIRQSTDQLAAVLDGMALGDGIFAFVRPATEHRAVLILRGQQLSARISDSDPKASGQPYQQVRALDQSMEAQRTAQALNRFLEQAHNVLSHHTVNSERGRLGQLPANFILTRGAGQMVNLQPISRKMGFSGSCISGEATVLGAARLAGFEAVTHANMTGNIDTDIALKAELALEKIVDHDFVCVHFKAPDLSGHDNKPLEKATAIERFDELVGMIASRLPEDVYLAVAADHSTPCELGEHSGEPVPVLLYGPSIRKDRNLHYNELDCAYGGMGHLTGNQFASMLHGFMGYVKKQGN